jgi:hypothetical protein
MKKGQLVKFYPNAEKAGQEELAKGCEKRGVDYISAKINDLKEDNLFDLTLHIPGEQTVLLKDVEKDQFKIVQ